MFKPRPMAALLALACAAASPLLLSVRASPRVVDLPPSEICRVARAQPGQDKQAGQADQHRRRHRPAADPSSRFLVPVQGNSLANH
ncbi:MAG: hypothetical protein IV092_04920 [Burkholderiaceae bacterium]|nr:hypothetical protein [Burkholderiaceae bacterium]